MLWAIAQVRSHGAVGYRWDNDSSGAVSYRSDKGSFGVVGYSSGKVSSDAVGHSLDQRSSSQYQTWSHPHICSEVASEDITYHIFSIRICQNVNMSDTIMRVCFFACTWVHVL